MYYPLFLCDFVFNNWLLVNDLKLSRVVILRSYSKTFSEKCSYNNKLLNYVKSLKNKFTS